MAEDCEQAALNRNLVWDFSFEETCEFCFGETCDFSFVETCELCFGGPFDNQNHNAKISIEDCCNVAKDC